MSKRQRPDTWSPDKVSGRVESSARPPDHLRLRRALGPDLTVVPEATGRPDVAQREISKLETVVAEQQARLQEAEEELGDVLVCLGQEVNKVVRLRGALEQRGVDVEGLLADLLLAEQTEIDQINEADLLGPQLEAGADGCSEEPAQHSSDLLTEQLADAEHPQYGVGEPGDQGRGRQMMGELADRRSAGQGGQAEGSPQDGQAVGSPQGTRALEASGTSGGGTPGGEGSDGDGEAGLAGVGGAQSEDVLPRGASNSEGDPRREACTEHGAELLREQAHGEDPSPGGEDLSPSGEDLSPSDLAGAAGREDSDHPPGIRSQTERPQDESVERDSEGHVARDGEDDGQRPDEEQLGDGWEDVDLRLLDEIPPEESSEKAPEEPRADAGGEETQLGDGWTDDDLELDREPCTRGEEARDTPDQVPHPARALEESAQNGDPEGESSPGPGGGSQQSPPGNGAARGEEPSAGRGSGCRSGNGDGDGDGWDGWSDDEPWEAMEAEGGDDTAEGWGGTIPSCDGPHDSVVEQGDPAGGPPRSKATPPEGPPTRQGRARGAGGGVSRGAGDEGGNAPRERDGDAVDGEKEDLSRARSSEERTGEPEEGEEAAGEAAEQPAGEVTPQEAEELGKILLSPRFYVEALCLLALAVIILIAIVKGASALFPIPQHAGSSTSQAREGARFFNMGAERARARREAERVEEAERMKRQAEEQHRRNMEAAEAERWRQAELQREQEEWLLRQQEERRRWQQEELRRERQREQERLQQQQAEKRDLLYRFGLQPDASWEDVKKAFRKFSKKYHPDKPGGDAKKFIKMREVYESIGKIMGHIKHEEEDAW